MRAVTVMAFGDAPSLGNLPVPDGSGATLVRVTCAGLNPVDYQLVDQLTTSSPYPFVLGVDVAGIVVDAPRGSGLRAGDRVFGMARTHGSYAEYTAVPLGASTEPLARIPDSVSEEEAATLPVAAIAALGSLELLSLKPRDRLVVMGAAGAVGGYALQMALSRGVVVAATVRGAAQADEARRLGADQVFDSAADDVMHMLRRSQPAGFDAILDIVSGSGAIQGDAQLLRSGGRLVSTVFGVDVAWFADRQISAFNVVGHSTPFGGTPNPKQTPQGLAEVAELLASGTITARIRATGELSDALRLLESLRAGHPIGKAIIRLG
jgi:NADPH:quinone reductase-like Zn-dependent oxidoreductase